MLEDKVA